MKKQIRELNIKSIIKEHSWLITSLLFSVILVGVRVNYTGSFAFLFLYWNLFLASIPYAISYWLMHFAGQKRWNLYSGLLTWLLFVPNSFYIITDLFHLDRFNGVPRWFDLILILSFAWNGLVMGVLSFNKIEKILISFIGIVSTRFVTVFVFWLIAFGIYIGRYLRFNSWDVLTNPFLLFSELGTMIIDPSDHIYAWSMTFCFSVFMFLMYYSIKKMVGILKEDS